VLRVAVIGCSCPTPRPCSGGVCAVVDLDGLKPALCRPFDVAGVRIPIEAGVGVHLAASATDSDQAPRAADHARYAVKKGRRDPEAKSGGTAARRKLSR